MKWRLKYNNEKDFKVRVLEKFERKDKIRVPDKKFQELLTETNNKLMTDEKYRTGYEKFVNSMSYAPDNEVITFDMALKCYQICINENKGEDSSSSMSFYSVCACVPVAASNMTVSPRIL